MKKNKRTIFVKNIINNFYKKIKNNIFFILNNIMLVLVAYYVKTINEYVIDVLNEYYLNSSCIIQFVAVELVVGTILFLIHQEIITVPLLLWVSIYTLTKMCIIYITILLNITLPYTAILIVEHIINWFLYNRLYTLTVKKNHTIFGLK